MSCILRIWHILLAAICSLVNQPPRQIIEFQNAQSEALLKKLGRKRLLLDNDQRRLSFLTCLSPRDDSAVRYQAHRGGTVCWRDGLRYLPVLVAPCGCAPVEHEFQSLC